MRAALTICLAAAVTAPGVAVGDVTAAVGRARSGPFDATGEVRCAQEAGQTLGTCVAKVARSEGSAAAVVVTFPNGFARMLTFEAGAFLRGDATMSGVGTDTDWTLSDGTYRVRVDDQRFELPEALVSGDQGRAPARPRP